MARRILIVDDDRDQADSLADYLQWRDFEVETANSNVEATETASRFVPGIALVDLRLGQSNGLDLVSSLRRSHPELICVLMTAYADSQTAVEALRRGVYDYLSKPLHPEELLAVLDRGFEKLALEDRLRAAYAELEKRVEQRTRELRLANERLEGEIDERRRTEVDLRGATARAEAASRAKSEFLSSISHELRTPLNAILGFAQILQLSPDVGGVPNHAERLEYILTAGRHLLDLIDQLLDLAAIEAGDLSFSITDVSVGEAVREGIALVEDLARSGGIGLIDDISGEAGAATVRADGTRLRQAIVNLLSNGVKYNRPKGRVVVDLGPAPPGRCRIRVADTGIGIPPDQQDRVFEPFSRLGLEGSDIKGTGIGLTITRRIVEMMDGEIGFESAVGRGTTFWIDLPSSEAGEAPAPPTAGTPAHRLSDVGRARILCVEDNIVNLKLLDTFLGSTPEITVLTARTAEEGERMAGLGPPDLVIVDINLPGASGIELARRLRRQPATRSVPLLGLSAAAMADDVERARKAGFDAYLTKPVDLSELVGAVVSLLGRGARTLSAAEPPAPTGVPASSL